MTLPQSNRIFFGWLGWLPETPNEFWDAVFEYMAANGWEADFSLTSAEVYNGIGPTTPNITTYLPNAIEYTELRGVPLWVDIENPLAAYQTGWWPLPPTDATSDWYEEYFGTAMDYMNSESYIQGYHIEASQDGAIEWMNEATGAGKQFLYYWDIAPPYHLTWPQPDAYPYLGWTHGATWAENVAWRLNLIDMLVVECYWISEVQSFISIMQQAVADFPSLPIGISTGVDVAADYWSINEPSIITWEEQTRLAASWLNYLKYQTRTFDIVDLLTSAGPPHTSVSDQCNFIKSLKLQQAAQWIELTNIANPT